MLTDASRAKVSEAIRGYAASCREETIQAVAESFYTNFIDGNGPLACRYVFGRARRQLMGESPNCDETVSRPAHSSDLHPHAQALVSADSRMATVTLVTTDGRRVGSLRMSDADGDNAWHIDDVRHLEKVTVPRPTRKNRHPARS